MRFLGSSSVIFIPFSRFKLNKQLHYYMQNTFQIVIVLTMIHKLELSMVVRLSEVIAQLRGNWTISSGGAENLIFQCQDIIWQSGKSKSWIFNIKPKLWSIFNLLIVHWNLFIVMFWLRSTTNTDLVLNWFHNIYINHDTWNRLIKSSKVLIISRVTFSITQMCH